MKAYAAQSRRPNSERDRLISEHVDVARRISMRVARRCPDWIQREDLVAAGLLGLTEAADRYDSSRNEPFLSFAEKRIRGAVPAITQSAAGRTALFAQTFGKPWRLTPDEAVAIARLTASVLDGIELRPERFGEIARESESVIQGMMGYKGRR